MAQRKGPVKDPERFVRRCNATAQTFRERLLDDLDQLEPDPILRDRTVLVLDLLHPAIRMLAGRPGMLSTFRPDLWLAEYALILGVRHCKTPQDELEITLRVDHTPHLWVSVTVRFDSPYVVDRVILNAQAVLRDVVVLPEDRVRRRGPASSLWTAPLTAAGLDGLADRMIALQANGAELSPHAIIEFIKDTMSTAQTGQTKPSKRKGPPPPRGKWEDA